jgi:predicted naringenin-chalcone synthase
MGCHAAINALRAATAFAAQDPAARVLVCAVELCSLHFQYGPDPDKAVANALFADGAAAAVVGGLPGPGRWGIASAASYLVPDTADAMTWRIGDHGFEMTLSPDVPEILREHLGPWLRAWLGDHGLSSADIGSWAIHPGGPKVITTVAACLDLPDSAVAESRAVLAEHGNMSSPTVLFIVDRLRRRHAGGPCVALAFGPGLVAEAVLLR